MNELDYLEHHGILGMHWGIRRYQNKDGSLTPEGMQRYRTDKKFAKKYDEDRAKQQKIANINKKQSGSYNFTYQDKKDLNRTHSKLGNTYRVAARTYLGNKAYKVAAGNKRTKGLANTGRLAVKAGLNVLEEKWAHDIDQNYQLSRFNDDGTVKKMSNKEKTKANRAHFWKKTGMQAGMTAMRAIADISITKLANTEWGDTFNRGARQKYDVNGKWATNPDRMRLG